MKSKPIPRCLEEVLKELYAKPPKPGMVTHITVRHENGCTMLAGRGPCDCRFVAQPGRVERNGEG